MTYNLQVVLEPTSPIKATGIEVGLLINFGERVEIKRKVYTPPKDCVH